MPQIIIQIAITFIVLISGGYFVWLVMFSIPYWPSDKKFINTLKTKLTKQRIKKVAEFGAGDGRIAIELCKMGYKVDAFEINPLLSLFIRLRKGFIKEGKNLNVYNENFLSNKINYSQYQAIILYLNPKLMSLLEKRLFTKMDLGSIIISNTFKFPNKLPENVYDKMLVYKVK